MNFQPNRDYLDTFVAQRATQVKESTDLFGYQGFYIKAENISSVDNIFGEIQDKSFLQANTHEIYFTRDEDANFMGQESFSMFGYRPSFDMIIRVPKLTFDTLGFDPQIDDLVWYPDFKKLFQITKVGNASSPQTGDVIRGLPLNKELFLVVYNGDVQNFETGIDDIDLEIDNDVLVGLNDTLQTEITNNDTTATPDNPFGEF